MAKGQRLRAAFRRLPPIQKLNHVVFRQHAGLLKFGGRVEESAVLIQNRNGRHTLFEIDAVFGGYIEIPGVLAHIHVDHQEVVIQERSDPRLMESLVQDMAIDAPVAAENQQNALMALGRGHDRLAYIVARVGIGLIEVGVRIRRRVQRFVDPLGEAKGREGEEQNKDSWDRHGSILQGTGKIADIADIARHRRHRTV